MKSSIKSLASALSLVNFLAISLSVCQPVKAEPLSCAGYAVTNPERQLVQVLQTMNAVKSEMTTIDEQLKELRIQMDKGYDSSSCESVNSYNLLVNLFNSLVLQRNQLNDKHNSLSDSFNSLVNVTSPSRNTSFVTCMNSEVVATDASTAQLNAENLNQQVENLN